MFIKSVASKSLRSGGFSFRMIDCENHQSQRALLGVLRTY